MRKETKIALAVVSGAVLAMIASAVVFWSGGDKKKEPAVVTPAVEQPVAPPSDTTDYDTAYDSEPVEEGVTRIIIENPELNDSEIQEILSEKIIINDEVKDIKELKSKEPGRSL